MDGDMKKNLMILLAWLGLAASALASPAQDLFDQGWFYINTYYYGFANVNLAELEKSSMAELTSICAPNPDTCPYSAAVPIIAKIVATIDDDHTNYLTAAQFQSVTTALTGGANTPAPVISARLYPYLERNAARIIEVLPGGAADKAGIKRGDLITAFNGKKFGSTIQNYNTEFRATIALGQPMVFSIERGTQQLEINVTPAVYRSTGLPWVEDLGNKTALLRIEGFDNPQTGKTIHDLVDRIKSTGFENIVIDLRYNGGGLATECLSGVGPFIGSIERIRETKTARRSDGYDASTGQVYSLVDGKRSQIYRLEKPMKWEGKLSVLVNDGSASCAEFFATDIKLAKRAAIIGTTTVGVGNTGTLIYGLLDGSGLQVTVVRSLRADGTPYPAATVPDIAITMTLDEYAKTGIDTQLNAGITALR
jgi:carboxyl-terminal processing protease